jgi:hypothetical protein
MLGSEEYTSTTPDLSETEFFEQVNSARNKLDKVYQTSRPLLALGYNGSQIRVLDSIYDAVRIGQAIKTKINGDLPFYRHHARFDNHFGHLNFNFSGNNDYRVEGGLHEPYKTQQRLPNETHPHLYLLRKTFGQDIELISLAERIFRGKYAGETNKLKKMLSRFSFAKSFPQIQYAYTCEWLDEDLKTDAVFHFPVDDDYVVFRKVIQTGDNEVWGQVHNTKSDRIRQALADKRERQVFNYGLVPALVPIRS